MYYNLGEPVAFCRAFLDCVGVLNMVQFSEDTSTPPHATASLAASWRTNLIASFACHVLCSSSDQTIQRILSLHFACRAQYDLYKHKEAAKDKRTSLHVFAIVFDSRLGQWVHESFCAWSCTRHFYGCGREAQQLACIDQQNAELIKLYRSLYEGSLCNA